MTKQRTILGVGLCALATVAILAGYLGAQVPPLLDPGGASSITVVYDAKDVGMGFWEVKPKGTWSYTANAASKWTYFAVFYEFGNIDGKTGNYVKVSGPHAVTFDKDVPNKWNGTTSFQIQTGTPVIIRAYVLEIKDLSNPIRKCAENIVTYIGGLKTMP